MHGVRDGIAGLRLSAHLFFAQALIRLVQFIAQTLSISAQVEMSVAVRAHRYSVLHSIGAPIGERTNVMDF